MTKTVCDICEREMYECCEVPYWSSFEKNETGLGYSISHDAEIVKTKLNLCRYHSKILATFIAKMIQEGNANVL